jgi:hypothetical protein
MLNPFCDSAGINTKKRKTAERYILQSIFVKVKCGQDIDPENGCNLSRLFIQL